MVVYHLSSAIHKKIAILVIPIFTKHIYNLLACSNVHRHPQRFLPSSSRLFMETKQLKWVIQNFSCIDVNTSESHYKSTQIQELCLPWSTTVVFIYMWGLRVLATRGPRYRSSNETCNFIIIFWFSCISNLKRLYLS